MTKWIAFLFTAALTSSTAFADTIYNCAYAFMGSPMATVELLVDRDGEPASSAKISMGNTGSAHKESVTPVPKAADELVHVWISKENPENEIEMIIYNTKKAEGSSVIINHKVPFGKHVWGDCTTT